MCNEYSYLAWANLKSELNIVKVKNNRRIGFVGVDEFSDLEVDCIVGLRERE
jgi:hypothetical protein